MKCAKDLELQEIHRRIGLGDFSPVFLSCFLIHVDEKDLRHELLIFYDTAIDLLRSELKALKGKTNGFVPLILIDDAQVSHWIDFVND